MAIYSRGSGKLDVVATSARQSVAEVLRHHVGARARQQLASAGYVVRSHALPNGEVEIVANEKGMHSGRDRALVNARIFPDGQMVVDVDCVAGSRCEKVVSDLAQAVGAEVTGTTRKAAYFQLPEEPAKVSRHV